MNGDGVLKVAIALLGAAVLFSVAVERYGRPALGDASGQHGGLALLVGVLGGVGFSYLAWRRRRKPNQPRRWSHRSRGLPSAPDARDETTRPLDPPR